MRGWEVPAEGRRTDERRWGVWEGLAVGGEARFLQQNTLRWLLLFSCPFTTGHPTKYTFSRPRAILWPAHDGFFCEG